MIEFKIGSPIIFTFKDKKRYGIVEDIRGFGKKKKFRIRDEAGKLYPDATLFTKLPVNIEVELTEKYIINREERSRINALKSRQ
mgnify:CR=1 FL=1